MALPEFGIPPENRSRNMRAIRSSGNVTTEKRLAALFKAHRIRGWRSQPPDILGKPDFIIRRKHIIIFVDGCFFHGCPRCGHIPRTNRTYWAAKISRNIRRDQMISKRLRVLGYRVIRIWECQLRENPNLCLGRVLRATRTRGMLTGKGAQAKP